MFRPNSAKHAPARPFFIGGKIGGGIGLPYSSPFSSLGTELDVTNNLALLVGGMRLVGWISAMGVRSYVGARTPPPLIGTCGRKSTVCMLVLIMPLAPGGVWLSLHRFGGFGGIDLDGGVIDGLSLLLSLGYKF